MWVAAPSLFVDDQVVFHEPTTFVDGHAVVAACQNAEIGGVEGTKCVVRQFFHEPLHGSEVF